LTTESLRRMRFALLAAAIMGTAACVHAPADRTLRGPAEEPVGVPAPAGSVDDSTPPAEASSTYPIPPVPGQIPPGIAGGSTGEEDAAAVGITPAQYTDLFDRIRAGFKLEDVDRRAVDQQLAWYANNPEYLERAFGRAELYLYHIVTEIESRGLPLELALLPVIESAFEPYAYSRARASGLWQFIPGTGSRFGLKQNWWYDGRRDVVESTRAALEYLKFLHDEFNGDWLLAIAGYNCGEHCVARAIERNRAAGLPTDFWSLRLPAETRAYVPKLLAMKRLVADPERFGLSFSPIPNKAYFARVETHGQIDLKLAAEIAGVTYEELYELNPAFHRWATDPSGPHYLLVPAVAAETFRQNLAQLTPDERMRVKRYVVQQGDTIAAIARRFNTTPNVIRELNDIPSGVLHIGTELRVPSEVVTLPPKVARAAALVDSRAASRPNVHVVRRGDSLWRIARAHGLDVNTLASINGMRPTDVLRTGQKLRLTSAGGGSTRTASGSTDGDDRSVTYTVRRGDTLTRIAKLLQVTVAQLARWNGIDVNDPIMPGQKLTVRVRSRG